MVVSGGAESQTQVCLSPGQKGHYTHRNTLKTETQSNSWQAGGLLGGSTMQPHHCPHSSRSLAERMCFLFPLGHHHRRGHVPLIHCWIPGAEPRQGVTVCDNVCGVSKWKLSSLQTLSSGQAFPSDSEMHPAKRHRESSGDLDGTQIPENC